MLAAIALLLPGHAAAQTNPPASGDWVVADNTVVNGGTVTVSGNLIVTSTGSLTLTGVALRIGSTYPGEFAILVANGGYLGVSGGVIQAQSAANTYRFELLGWADIDRTTVSDMWGSSTQEKFGIQIYNGNVTITNSSIRLGQRGNIMVMAGSPFIFNNTIESAGYLETANTSQWMCNYIITYSAVGIYAANKSSPVIVQNLVRNNGASGTITDRSQAYYDVFYPQCLQGYLQIQENVYGYGIEVRGADAEIHNNTITGNSYCPTTSISRVINGVSVYVYRYSDQPYSTPDAGAGLLLGIGKGNVTGNTIDRNLLYGIYGDGSLAVVENNNVSNHRQQTSYGLGGGILVGGGIQMRNNTLYENLNAIVLVGSGTGVFEGGTIKNVSAASSRAIYIFYYGSGTLNLYNISFETFTQAVTFDSNAGASLNLFNCTIDASTIDTAGATGFLNIYWPLQMRVQWPNGAPAAGAFAILTNNTGAVLYADVMGSDGRSAIIWIAGVSSILNSGNPQTVINDRLAAKIFANGTVSDPFAFRFNQTTFLVVTISDPVPPSLNVFFPVPGQGFKTSTIHATGNAFDVGSGMDRVEASVDGGVNWIPSTEALPGWGIDIDVADGTYDLAVRAYDLSGTFTELTIEGVVVDTVSPDIIILQPSLPVTEPMISYTTLAAVTLQGKVADDTTLTLNGNALAVQGGTFSRQLILSEGPNYFDLVAVDPVGNRDEVTFILVSDITKPALFVSSPTDNFATNRSVITIAGVSETDVAVTLNDRSIHTSGGVFSEAYALSEGPNTIRITAIDRAGNNATITRTVLFDTVPPDIFLSSPTPNMLTAVSDLTVAGSVESAILMVYVNGAPVPTNHGVFSKAIRLDEGRNVVVVSAWDPAGNPATTSAVVTLDSLPPEVAVAAPLEGALVNTATITVRGTIANATRLVLNGINITGATDAFDEEVALVEGANLITLVVFDAAGNTARSQVTVFRDSQAPVLAVDLPETPKHTLDNVVKVTGHVTGAASLRANGQLVAFDPDGAFTVTVTLAMGENRITFTALDTAGNEITVLGAVVRDPVPPEPQGMLGLGNLQYLLLFAFLGAGIAGTFVVLRRPRKGDG